MANQKKAGRKTSGKRRAAQKKQPVRREVGGGVCLLLSLFIGVSYFQHEALLIRWLYTFCRGTTGWGWFVTLPALLLAAWILLLHRGRPVLPHLAGALLLPVLTGALIHTAVRADVGEGSVGLLKLLWQSGTALESGGVLSGALAIGFMAVLGRAATMVLFAPALAGCLMAALRLTPAAVVEAIRSRELTPYEEPEETEAAAARRRAKEEKAARKREERAAREAEKQAEREEREAEAREEREARSARQRPSIDIPLDGEDRPESPLFGGAKRDFFPKKSERIRTPDELLNDEETPPSSEADSPEPAPAPKLDPLVSPKPAGKADKRSEVELAAEAVTAEIEAAAETREYRFPPLSLLSEGEGGGAEEAGAELRENSRRLAETLKSFGVEARAGEVVRGPSVTRYEFILEQGVKLSKITNLQDDIALALGATGVRIAPIPDKISVVGVEVPNKSVTPVYIRDVLSSAAFARHKSGVCFSVGKDINGSPIVGDIARFPHVLIAGTTGSGKSVCTNSLIVSMLYKSTPENVRFIMVDPKMVELAPYNGIPHLLIPVVTDPKKAAGALQWAVYEMMKRYKAFSEHNVKDLAAYNALAESDPELKKLPTIVVIIDELADLMLVASKEVEESICRVAQMGRASGMHLVIATQRPSTDVITGLMKANIPSRIAFAVASGLESRIILDATGAEKLVGKGDMLYAPLGEGKPRRVQGCFISAGEIERVVGFVKENGVASYDKDVIDKIEQNVAEKERGGKGGPAAPEEPAAEEADEMLDAAIEVVLETGQASTSLLQRRLKLGYSRAARIVDQMEQRGIVGPFEGSKPRQLLITREKWQELKMKGQKPAAPAPEENA